MKKIKILCLLLIFISPVFSQDEEAIEHSPGNSQCFVCHGSHTFSFYNEITEQNVTKRMNPYLIIDSNLYYDQNHKTFECLDCHPYDYNDFPHSNDLRMEPLPSCMDCHEGDDATAQYNFEQINEQFLQSRHSTEHSEQFTCWMCHDPHSYKINARNNTNIKETIVYDNNICLSCHADKDKYQMISTNTKPSVIDKHDWLPNQIAHFASVRCIECHTHTSDSTMVAHHIQSKEKAVKNCVECHSKNATLLTSLYKFQAVENRSKFGFFNAETLTDSYIIGANRNYFLNVISAFMFGLILLIILIHIILRIKLK